MFLLGKKQQKMIEIIKKLKCVVLKELKGEEKKKFKLIPDVDDDDYFDFAVTYCCLFDVISFRKVKNKNKNCLKCLFLHKPESFLLFKT